MDKGFWLLGPEGDRLDALAAMHGVCAGLAFGLRARRPERQCERRKGAERQERALIALAAALARVFRRQGEPGFVLDVEAPALVALMARADAGERRGVSHDVLARLPAEWPFKRLAVNPAQLALAVVMRLRVALQDVVIRNAGARRQVQLAAVRDLEKELLALAHGLAGHQTTPAAALRVAVNLFAAAAMLIGPGDIGQLLGDGAVDADQRHGTTILTGADHGFAA